VYDLLLFLNKYAQQRVILGVEHGDYTDWQLFIGLIDVFDGGEIGFDGRESFAIDVSFRF
jgi:hypothetical protein